MTIILIGGLEIRTHLKYAGLFKDDNDEQFVRFDDEDAKESEEKNTFIQVPDDEKGQLSVQAIPDENDMIFEIKRT